MRTQAHLEDQLGDSAPYGLPDTTAERGGRMDDIGRIAVLRTGGLGDLLFAIPAMRALSASYPEAEITLIGSPGAAALLRGRPGPPDHIVELPLAPDDTPSAATELPSIPPLAGEHGRGYDLAVQLRGGRDPAEGVPPSVEARCTIGVRTPDGPALDRSIEYVFSQHEALRGLEVAGLVGAKPVELEPVLSPRPEELAKAHERFGSDRPIVVLHPGAADPRWRWPAARFARVAAELAREGLRIVIVGLQHERPLCRSIAFMANEAAAKVGPDLVIDASGSLSVSDLVGLLGISRLMVGNDSGPRHLAQAVGTATASVYWFVDLICAGPLERARHRVQIGWTIGCPVCGNGCVRAGMAAPSCEHSISYVAEVPSSAVLADARRLLGAPDADPT